MPQANNSGLQNNPSMVWLDLPPRFSIEISPDRLIITREWFSEKIIGPAIFALIWNAAVILFALNTSIWVYFGMPHGWIAIWLAYYALTGILNSTIITLTASRITVEHGPIPYPGNTQLKTRHLRQLYTKEKNSHSHRTYEVRMKTNSGQDLPLVTNLDYSEQALYIENQIEEFLGIENEPVAGELKNYETKHQRPVLDSWKQFAQTNQLDLKPYGVSGIYQGYSIYGFLDSSHQIQKTMFRTINWLERPSRMVKKWVKAANSINFRS